MRDKYEQELLFAKRMYREIKDGPLKLNEIKRYLRKRVILGVYILKFVHLFH
jgi:hypothetical protein